MTTRLRTSTAWALVLAVTAIVLASSFDVVRAYPEDSWSVAEGGRLEVLRDYACFGESRTVERSTKKDVMFSGEVLSAEVFISGFNIWYTREGHDHEVIQQRVDAFVDHVGYRVQQCPEGTRCPGLITQEPSSVTVELVYVLRDEDAGDSDDLTDACIGFTVLAHTR